MTRKDKGKKEFELYVSRFNAMGLELPEATTANARSMGYVASFLLHHEVFGKEELEPLQQPDPNDAKDSED